MKKFLLILVAMFAFLSCSQMNKHYTVWTVSGPYSEWAQSGITVSDGYYTKMELSNSEWKDIVSTISNEYKHSWNEDKIYDWFIGRGASASVAHQEVAWLTTTNHGLIVARSGSVVNILLK